MAVHWHDFAYQKLTPELALKFRLMTPTRRERKMSEERLEKYQKLLDNDKFVWHWCHWVTAYCREDRTLYRVNGQHTSQLACNLFESGKNTHRVIVVERWEVDTVDEVLDIYLMLDSVKGSRKLGDMITAISGEISGLENANQVWLGQVTAGVSMALQHMKELPSKLEVEDRAILPRTWHEFYRWVEYIGLKVDKKRYAKAAVVAAMFLVWRKDVDLAYEFFKPFFDTSMELSGTRRLLDVVVRSSIDQGKADRKDLFYRCIIAFNAWNRGIELKIIKLLPDHPPKLDL